MPLALDAVVAILADLRYSARSLTRSPGVTLALLLTIALGIGSNAAVYGFVRGLVARELPLPGLETVVSLIPRDTERSAGTVSYEHYLALRDHRDIFEWVGTARESQGTVVLADWPEVTPVAAVSPELANLFDLSVEQGVTISHRLWRQQLGGKADVHGRQFRIDGVETHVAHVAPEWLDGLYLGRAVDIWMPLREEALDDSDRRSQSFWVLGRLRPGVSTRQAQAALDGAAQGAGGTSVLPYTGMTPGMTDGLSRIGTLLSAAAGAVFFIACANVASLLLGRASARARETSVRVALGARRGQLARQLLADSVVISVTGGALGMLLAVWTLQIVPALFFEQDAEHLIFAPDRFSIVAACIACSAITIVCGLVPFFEVRDDRPGAVLQRESAGPSVAMRRVRAGLVVAQMTGCCLLVISTGLLVQGLRSALQTRVAHRLGQPILATLASRPFSTRSETVQRGLEYFSEAEQAAQSMPEVVGTAWVGRLPGSYPAWQSLRIEPAKLPMHEVTLEVAPFTPQSLALLTVPPVAGRMFGGQDSTRSCKVVVVNEEAATLLFDGDAVGRSIEDRAGERVEIIGVVAMRTATPATAPPRPTVFYYAQQTAPPLDKVGPASFRVPTLPPPARAVVDAHVVSPNYFDAMGFTALAGRVFPDPPAPGSCRVGVINQEAADLYFGGQPIGASVIDGAGRRTEIIGVVQSAPLRTFQRAPDPAIYFPMAQDFQLSMTLVVGARDPNEVMLTLVRRRLNAVPHGGALAIVRTLDEHLSRTALAPLRIATVLVGASAATALALGVLGLYGALTDAARQRRRELAVRIALGAQGWRVIRQVVEEGGRLAAAGAVAGMLGSLVVARALTRIAPNADGPALWVWLAAPLVLIGVVALASVLPARRALNVDPLTITRDDH